MTERVDPAVRGRDKGWRNDEPTALRKGGDDMDGIKRVIMGSDNEENNFMNDKNTVTRSKGIYVGPTTKNIKKVDWSAG